MSSSAIQTRTEQVYAAIRSEILLGKLAPSTRLRLVELAERFSVSQSVVREALTRLAEQKIVVALPQQGFRVASLSLDDLVALTEARLEIENLVLRLAVAKGGIDWETAVVATHHTLLRTPPHSETGEAAQEWLSAHEAFHVALLHGCDNPHLLHAAAMLRDAAALYRIWSVPLGGDQDRDLVAEHRAILDAVLSRDADLAVALLTEHIEHTSAVLLTVAQDDSAPDST